MATNKTESKGGNESKHDGSQDEATATAVTTIIIDTGSDTIKAGHCGSSPTHVVSCQSGELRRVQPAGVAPKEGSGGCSDNGKNGIWLGQVLLDKRGLFTFTNPVDKGIITNWDHMEALWRYTLIDQLAAIPSQHRVCIHVPLLFSSLLSSSLPLIRNGCIGITNGAAIEPSGQS
jgi:actin-related protein